MNVQLQQTQSFDTTIENPDFVLYQVIQYLETSDDSVQYSESVYYVDEEAALAEMSLTLDSEPMMLFELIQWQVLNTEGKFDVQKYHSTDYAAE